MTLPIIAGSTRAMAASVTVFVGGMHPSESTALQAGPSSRQAHMPLTVSHMGVSSQLSRISKQGFVKGSRV